MSIVAGNYYPSHALLFKPDMWSPLIGLSSGQLYIKSGIYLGHNAKIFNYSGNTDISMPTLVAGTDYFVWIGPDGTPIIDASSVTPTGYSAGTCRMIGGFHYAPGGNAAAQAGGDTIPAINPYSLWDVKFRPSCPDPRGMALIGGQFWCDIYLLGINPQTDGTSRNNVTIADGSSPSRIPVMFGGNGSTVYGQFNWWDACEVMLAYGKQLLSYDEFSAAAFGVTEEVQRGNDPVTTGLGTTNAGSSNADEKFTSRWGIIQATACLWVWGRQLGGPDANLDHARGYSNSLPNAALFGGSWFNLANCGSRASSWNYAPSHSNNSIGARGRCDHVCHV